MSREKNRMWWNKHLWSTTVCGKWSITCIYITFFLTLDLYTRNMEKYNFSSSKMNLDLYSRSTYKSEIYGRCVIKHLDKIAHIGAYLGARYSKNNLKFEKYCQMRFVSLKKKVCLLSPGFKFHTRDGRLFQEMLVENTIGRRESEWHN